MKAIDLYLQRYRISMVAPYIGADAAVLDVGSSDGSLVRHVPRVGRYVGVDPDLGQPRVDGKVTLLRGYFPDALPDHRPFDVITLLAVLEHVPTDQQPKLAAACADHLVPGGWLLITAPSPTVDHVLAALKVLRLIDGMSLEQHYGFDPRQTPTIFAPPAFTLERHRRFQLGLNHLFAFRRA